MVMRGQRRSRAIQVPSLRSSRRWKWRWKGKLGGVLVFFGGCIGRGGRISISEEYGRGPGEHGCGQYIFCGLLELEGV
jgi:hypothetical protein